MKKKKRVVIKVGTSTLSHGGKGLNFRNIDGLARVLTDIKNAGHEVILVSSGAIGAGCGKLNMKGRPVDVRLKQAVAAVGQCELMHVYDKFFSEYGAPVGQILLTRDDVDRPNVRLNLLGTFEALLELGVIPVVNENDSVCIEEIESEHKVFGDNDTLSAVVATLVDADLLVILSDIDGLFDKDPRKNKDASLIPVVDAVDGDLLAEIGGAGTAFGTGGMQTKLAAAKIATENGIDMVITNGANPRNLYDILEGKGVGTLFRKKGKKA
ncbi:glutamate 5-kinase [Oscillospiraceae bacterium CM]|nr:glutamate 5-kinase [Oscillospiraceae bacterium CM]